MSGVQGMIAWSISVPDVQITLSHSQTKTVSLPLGLGLKVANVGLDFGVSVSGSHSNSWDVQRYVTEKLPSGSVRLVPVFIGTPQPDPAKFGSVDEAVSGFFEVATNRALTVGFDFERIAKNIAKEMFIDQLVPEAAFKLFHFFNPSIEIEGAAGTVAEPVDIRTIAFWPGGEKPTGPVPLSGLDAVGAAWDIGPAGITLVKPISLTIGYEDGFLGDVAPADLQIYRLDATGWHALPSTVDASARTVRAETSALGLFVIGIDREAPRLRLLAPQNDQVLAANASRVTFAIEDGVTPTDELDVAVSIDGVARATTVQPNGSAFALLPSLADGPHTLDISVTDAAGNAKTRQVLFGTDSVPPPAVTGLTAAWAGDHVELSWAGAPGANVEIHRRNPDLESQSYLIGDS